MDDRPTKQEVWASGLTGMPNWRGAAAIVAGIALVWVPVLMLHLVPAMFAALITYGATRALAALLRRRWPAMAHSEGIALAVILLLLGTAIGLGLEHLLDARQRPSLFAPVMDQMAVALESLRAKLPAAAAEHLPASIESLRQMAIEWLRKHAAELQTAGGHVLRGVGHALIGIVIGALAAMQVPRVPPDAQQATPLERWLRSAFDRLTESFTAVVFAQLRISAINTALTAVYLVGILPLLGMTLPMTPALLLITFLTGLLPVVGNLISNTVLTVVSLTQSPTVAVMSLAWLVGIHKLEYFLNAEIVGKRIQARSWELLIVMLVFEAAFGIGGLVSAPVVYAQLKQALGRRGWVGLNGHAAPHAEE